MPPLTLIHNVTGADGYEYDECSELLAQLCLALPCFPAVHFPNYDTKIFEDTIDGNPVVIQLWKGRCDHFLLLPNMPGGVGGELGVYRRISGKTLPTSVPPEIQPLLVRAAAAVTAAGGDLWWPYPELQATLELELINPRTGKTFFRAGPGPGNLHYWLSRWMRFTSYDRYKAHNEHPAWAHEYWMIGRVNGRRYLWGPPELATRDAMLHVAGVTADGRLWHSIRDQDGAWQRFGDVEGPAGDCGTVVDVDLQSVENTVHLCAVNTAGALWHTIRRDDGSWQRFGDVRAANGNYHGAIKKVGVASIDRALHVCVVTADGRLLHTIRRPDGSWQGFGDVEGVAGERGTFTDVDCAEVRGELHVLGVTSAGRLWHTIRRANGSWQGFGDVEGAAGDRGTITKIACAGVLGELHACAVSADGRLWHTIRAMTGAWKPFADAELEAGERGSFACVSIGELAGRLHVAGVTTDGRLWHTIRSFDGTRPMPFGQPFHGWQTFGDVESQAGDRGTFTTVSLDGLIR